MPNVLRLILLIFIVVSAFSCSVIYQTKKAYKKIESLPPISKTDSIYLANRSAKTFPIKKDTVVKEGKTTTKIIVKEDKAKVTALSKRIDSLLDSNQALADRSVRAQIRREIAAECTPKTVFQTDTRTDTIFAQSRQDALLIASLQLEKELLTKAKEKTDTLLEQSKKNSTTKTWWIVGLGLLSILLAIILFRSFFGKSTNKLADTV